MSIIREMSENLANKIAAGEVIEKCSSIVKELVENSIDAKSNNIKIELLKGGLEKITVIDDGIGMDKTDSLLCFKSHATSKIYKDDDLYFINTLGFRGEALPSIASVSKVTLTTSKGSVGTKVVIKGGNVLETTMSDARIGTKMEVEDIFYNTPARLKYLKSENSELASIVNFVEKLSLSKPSISFTLTNNSNTILRTTGSGELLKTIHEIYGSNISSNMIKINGLDDDAEISGFICKPLILKSTRNNMITIINGRVVRNTSINKSINDAYYTYKPVDKYPVVVLNIEIDPTLEDVNIHPTKQDIKISKIDNLCTLIYNTIKDCLYKELLIPDAINIEDSNILEETPIYNNTSYIQEEMDLNKKTIINKNEQIKSLTLYPVGLCHGTYIVAENEEGIYLIDQHAAQERVNYEKYLLALKNEEIHTISMLIPISIELSSSDYISLKEKIDILTNLGFLIEDFGINTILIKSHPFWLLKGYEEEQIRKIIDLVIELKEFDPIKFRKHVAITLACKMAIKANDHISHMQMEELLNNLTNCDNPYNCPHGRPTIIKFSNYDLEKMFKRAM
jgi:DNA mismatch repair protein MutL